MKMHAQPFQGLQEATDIAVEKEFLMPKCSRGISCLRCILVQRTMCGDQYLYSK